ncbi:3-phosphoshikimate 1-carboxyvinyltransferase, partial [candidate division KSB1 bacterium]|nr:3-phosphoshikimate 1-carboxyvinyltransferase [candidate division KSB1 bacterium]
MDAIITPSSGLRGAVMVSTDKSISHRALIMAAIAEGVSIIRNLSDSADVQSTKTCLQQLGIRITDSGETTTVHGAGINGFRESERILDAGNSGTTMRLLSGLLAGQNFNSIITGDSSLIKRPMKRITTPL